MSTRVRRSGENFLAMTVHNIGFMLDRLGQDCHPLQYLRELTQNAVEAIARSGKPGQITWDVDWTTFELEGVYKLSLTDTGDGMTGDELIRFINQLSSSVAQQSMSGNYGVGAKISAATRSHAGVLYLSWKDGEGSMIHLFRDPQSGQYGLRQFEHKDGTYAYFLPIEDDVKPEAISKHGTKVVLLGNSPDANTMFAPPGSPSPSRWISKYLNTRYFKFPEGISVRAREGWEYPRSDGDRHILRTIAGQGPYLAQHALSSGRVELSNARAHWWILKDEPALTNNSGFAESSGHVAALYNDELYELTTARAGMSKLQQFGVTFGYRYVVIYVEPKGDDDRNQLTTNTARTALLLRNEPLPWAEWASEFRENIPDEIAALVEEKAAGAVNTDHQKAIRDRLKDLLAMFRVSRYRATPDGDIRIDDTRMTRGGSSGEQTRRPAKDVHVTTGKPGGTSGNVYAVFEKTDGPPGKKLKPDPFPVVNWVSIKDGSREYGDIEDRAAKFLADQNRLLANADFRVFQDMANLFANEFVDVPGVSELAREAVRGWFEQALVETVMGVQALVNSKEWTPQNIDAALSEESLTAAVMQRYHVLFAVRRELGSKLGRRATS